MNLGNISFFQTLILIVFGLALLGGVLAISLYSGQNSGPPVSLTMWGPYPPSVMNPTLKSIKEKHENISVSYKQISYNDFTDEFILSLADQIAPDLVVIPNDLIIENQNRLFTIPFDLYGEGDFLSSFAEVGEIFLTPDGTLGLPVSVDPLVMYRNRSLFNQEAIVSSPRIWDDLRLDNYLRLIKRNGQDISQSMVAMGGYDNINNAKYILAMLMMQAGSPVIDRGPDGSARVLLNLQLDNGTSPGEAALAFYTQFAESGETYSWNNSLPNSRQLFVQGNLAMYFGFSSEYSEIQERNPNLNFAVGPIPQRAGASEVTSARVEAVAITQQTSNKSAALTVARELSSPEAVEAFSSYRGTPPVLRDMLSDQPDRAHQSVFYDAVFHSRSWLDPDPSRSEAVFRNMVNDVRSGSMSIRQAVNRANGTLESFIN